MLPHQTFTEADILQLFKEAGELVDLQHYRAYVACRQRGLKNEAKDHLKQFANVLSGSDKKARRVFADVAHRLFFYTGDGSLYLPYNLWMDFVKPDIASWIEEEPTNPIPLRWSESLEHKKRAVMVNGSDQLALLIFANTIIGKVSMNQHELAAGFPYDGNATEDLALLAFLEPFIEQVADDTLRGEIVDTIIVLKNTARAHGSEK